MPFAEEWRDMYERGIRPACASAGFACARVDDQIFAENILLRIYAELERADIVIAEMSGRNPNVLYETGYAHALGKRVILLTRSVDDIPFDLRHYSHIVHGGQIATARSELERRMRAFASQPQAPRAVSGGALDVNRAIAVAAGALARLRLLDCRVTPTALRRGEDIAITYEIASGCPSPITVWLGADSWPYYNVAQDVEVVVEPGVQSYRRVLTVGDEWPSGRRELGVGVWVGEKSVPEKSHRVLVRIPAATIEVL
jgi:hypothetical protein